MSNPDVKDALARVEKALHEVRGCDSVDVDLVCKELRAHLDPVRLNADVLEALERIEASLDDEDPADMVDVELIARTLRGADEGTRSLVRMQKTLCQILGLEANLDSMALHANLVNGIRDLQKKVGDLRADLKSAGIDAMRESHARQLEVMGRAGDRLAHKLVYSQEHETLAAWWDARRAAGQCTVCVPEVDGLQAHPPKGWNTDQTPQLADLREVLTERNQSIDILQATNERQRSDLELAITINAQLRAEISALKGDLRQSCADVERLSQMIDSPEIIDFLEGTKREAGHQRKRWGEAKDREKSSEHWYWLVGYLAGKALRAHIEGDFNKGRHHTISSAAALFHWHCAMTAEMIRHHNERDHATVFKGHGVGRDADLEAHNDGRQAHETEPVRDPMKVYTHTQMGGAGANTAMVGGGGDGGGGSAGVSGYGGHYFDRAGPETIYAEIQTPAPDAVDPDLRRERALQLAHYVKGARRTVDGKVRIWSSNLLEIARIVKQHGRGTEIGALLPMYNDAELMAYLTTENAEIVERRLREIAANLPDFPAGPLDPEFREVEDGQITSSTKEEFARARTAARAQKAVDAQYGRNINPCDESEERYP